MGVARAAPPADGAAWVLIDTQAFTLTVFDAHDRMIARYKDIAIGRGGAADVHYRSDQTTPLGTFRVVRIDPRSRFGVFFEFDYPTPAAAARAYRDDRITRASLQAILDAFRRGRLPPQDTALGGELGIHGTGDGSPVIQRDVNWTTGCVALTNHQAFALERWVRVGSTVVVR